MNIDIIDFEFLNSYANLEYLTTPLPNDNKSPSVIEKFKYSSTIDAAFSICLDYRVKRDIKILAFKFICYVYSIIGIQIINKNNDTESFLSDKYNINKMFLYNLSFMYEKNVNIVTDSDMIYQKKLFDGFNMIIVQYLDIVPILETCVHLQRKD